MLNRECRFGIKNLEEIIRFYEDVPEILELIKELGWKDKKTLKALKMVKKLLSEVHITLSSCLDSAKRYQKITTKIFGALDEVGLTEVASELILAKRKINKEGLRLGD